MNTISWIVIVAGLSCLLLPVGFQNKPHTDLEGDDLLGSVHTVKVVKKTVSSSDMQANSGSQITIYSPTGNKTEEQYFDGTGVLQNKRVFSYSASGRLVDIIEYGVDGLVISKTVHVPNATKNEVEEVYYDRQGNSKSKQVRVYNEQGKPIKLSAYSPNGVINEAISSYDAKGSLIETWQWAISGGERKLLGRTTFDYLGDRRNVITYFDSDGAQVGNVIASKNSDGSAIRVEEYDVKGSLINAKLFVRKLDSMRNWIVENTFQEFPKNGPAKLVEITNRTITYY